ncbi:hypothetical protein [Sporosarcina sp. SAFN-010]|uniref:hypothetical protein n=1 Tax=Sporosarcina sp. SAFN-010 TaxID=3387273 RepID=UPI000F63D1B6|nr:Uncharacterised protein [Lysinibacillus sphaericus]
MLIMFIGVLLVPFFIFTLATNFKFFKGEGSKSDLAQNIVAKSSKIALPIFPVGWVILELYHRIIANISYESYRDSMVVLMLLLFTVYGFAIRFYKKKYEFESQGLLKE